MQENDVSIYEEKKDPSQSEYDWEIELRDKVRTTQNPPPVKSGLAVFI